MTSTPVLPLRKRPWLRRIVWITALVVLALLIKVILHLLLPRNITATGEMLPLELAGGPFQVPCFAGSLPPKGIVILGTGDGGWSYWEENTAKHLASNGYAVGGWDCRKWADTRTYNQEQLSAGYLAAVKAVRQRTGADDEVPVWFGGWSTGAEQSVAAAAGPHRPPQLIGLLLAAPGTRGRYGLTKSDLLGATPTGPDTFALADLAPRLQGLKVVQFCAGLDPMDDEEWIKRVPPPWLILRLPHKLHDMGNAGPEFQAKVDEAIAWTLQSAPATP